MAPISLDRPKFGNVVFSILFRARNAIFRRMNRLLHQVRKARGITLDQLADLTKLSRSSLDRYELGRSIPKSDAVLLLNKALNLTDQLASLEDVRPGSRRRGKTGRGPTPVLPDFRSTWRCVDVRYPDAVSHLPRRLPQWFQAMTRCDSALEPIGWLILLNRLEALPQLASPACEGYLRHPVVDENGWGSGNQLLPCLTIEKQHYTLLIWPQVWLRTKSKTYRVDALVRFQVARSVFWCGVEFDGPNHDAQRDERRTRDLAMPILRFTAPEVESFRFPDLLLARLLEQPLAA